MVSRWKGYRTVSFDTEPENATRQSKVNATVMTQHGMSLFRRFAHYAQIRACAGESPFVNHHAIALRIRMIGACGRSYRKRVRGFGEYAVEQKRSSSAGWGP
jgi:hypothetical protein